MPELIGINKASTFTGFCTSHDDMIFAPVEKVEFAGTAEQCFLLGYRAVSRECYTKESASMIATLAKEVDKGAPVLKQLHVQSFANAFGAGNAAGIRDGKKHKGDYDAILSTGDFTDVRAYIITLEAPPPVMCCGGFSPEEDFNGMKLQDLLNLEVIPDIINLTSFACGERGYIVLSWTAASDGACLPFISSLEAIPDEAVVSAVVRTMFEHSENVFMRPDWWESLPHSYRVALVRRMNMSGNPLIAPRVGAMLVDDGLTFTDWGLLERRRIGY